MRRAALALLAVVLAWRSARADDDAPAAKPSYRVVVDRVELQPSSITGARLLIELSALTLQGQLLDLTDPKTIKTTIGGQELKAPFALGTFANTKEALALVIIVQTSIDYTEVLPVITEALDTSLLGPLDETVTKVAILPYGEAIGAGKLGSMKSARSKVVALVNDGSSGDMALLDTIDRGLSLLKRAVTEPEGRPLRKVILLISDGRDRAQDKERVTKLGQRADKEGVRIHSFAYSPTDTRRPLLVLGELSKRSQGTFRWLQRGKSDSWGAAFEQLRDEILKQYVLTYFLPSDMEPSGKKLKVETLGRVVASSNEMKVPDALCAGEVCAGYCTGLRCAIPQAPSGRGIFGWVLLIGGIGLGGILVLGVIGYVMSKRQAPIPLPPGVVLPPGMVPPSQAPKAKKEKKAKAPKGMPPQAVPGSIPPPAAAPSGPVPHLMFLNGPRAGERMPVRNGFTIGKAPGCDLVIEDGFTSSQHAQIGMDHFGNCRLFDQGSTNGTFANGVRVTEYSLEHGVSVRIGSTELRFLAQ